MVTEFNGFSKGVIGKKLPSDTTLNNMKKEDLIELLHLAQHNYESLMWFYNNAVNVNVQKLANKWIPVTEHLPEKCISVLIQDKEKILIGFCDTDNKWYGVYGSIILGNVIAWQPLPEPYKGE